MIRWSTLAKHGKSCKLEVPITGICLALAFRPFFISAWASLVRVRSKSFLPAEAWALLLCFFRRFCWFFDALILGSSLLWYHWSRTLIAFDYHGPLLPRIPEFDLLYFHCFEAIGADLLVPLLDSCSQWNSN
jgi:hypothetical protein